MKWERVRFRANFEDSRPVKFPLPGPYWETGLACDGSYATVISYFPRGRLSELKEYWPEANNIEEPTVEKEILFTSRFPKPEWWRDE